MNENLIAYLVAYLIGAIPFGLLFGLLFGGKKIKTSIAIGKGSEEISYEKQEQKILLIDNDDKKSRDSQDGQRDTGFDKKDRE